ncbi:flagellar assembly protein H [Photobacterium sp. BZF1]|nr:flagellar assembly protein H [Photobacterium sp. BZF1]
MFRRNRIMRLQPSQFRSHRFPPLVDAEAMAQAAGSTHSQQPENAPGAGPSSDFDADLGLGEEFDIDELGFDNLAMDDFGLDELSEDARLLQDSRTMTGAGEEPVLDPVPEPRQQEDFQAQFNQGFQQGMTRGHEEGLQQGIEQGQQQGFEQGIQQGCEQGIKQGIEEGKAQFIKATAPFALMHQQTAELFADHERRQREQVCELVQKVAQQVIRCELALQPQQIMALVEETLESLPGEPQGLKVKMAREEFTHLEKVASDKIDEWNIVCDDTLRQGECRVVTKNAEADAGCEQRLDTCMSAVKAHLLDEQVAVESSQVSEQEKNGEVRQVS